MKIKIRSIIHVTAFVGLITFGSLTFAFAEMTGRQIMDKQKQLHKVKTEVLLQKMILIDKSGKKEERTMKIYTKETAQKDIYNSLMVFLEPADIKGTALLSWQHQGAEDDQWLFLPAQKKMQRIAQGSKKNYFMGTDFTFEDFQREDLDAHQYKLVRSEKMQDKDSYVIEAVPASDSKKKDSAYGRRLIWIEKTNFVTLKSEFYDKRDKLIKFQENRDWEQASGTIWRAKKGLMDNTSMQHKTLVGLVQKTINQPIDDKTFTDRFILSGGHTQ
jgi:hypothetical protein